jgi:hypothetical protein
MSLLGIIASQNYPRITNSYESIATVTVGSGGAANIEFTSIPSTFTHLQIRGIARGTRTEVNSGIDITLNSDTATNYSYHALYGNATSALAYGYADQTYMYTGGILAASSSANCFSPLIIDILDYKNTNKYKTLRMLCGAEYNNAAFDEVSITSGLWRSTSAITSIKLTPTFNNHAQYTQFALYGIKGA